MKQNLRSPLAKARDRWLLSKEGTRAQHGYANGQYLANRLVEAFIAGWDAHLKDSKLKGDHDVKPQS